MFSLVVISYDLLSTGTTLSNVTFEFKAVVCTLVLVLIKRIVTVISATRLIARATLSAVAEARAGLILVLPVAI